MKSVEQYLAYWQTYIQPLADKEPKRYLHFTDTLNQVGKRFHTAGHLPGRVKV